VENPGARESDTIEFEVSACIDNGGGDEFDQVAQCIRIKLEICKDNLPIDVDSGQYHAGMD